MPDGEDNQEIHALEDDIFAQREGLDIPFNPANACCQAPCPGGAFCNTKCCTEKTQYWVQKWTCVWKKTVLECESPSQVSTECAWTKVWRCNFHQIERCDVLKALCCRKPARCPLPDDCYHGECDCFVPEDVYFAKVFEIEYVECVKPGFPDPKKPCHVYDVADPDHADPMLGGANPAGCACCGLTETCMPRWVRIHCKDQIPPEYPFEVPLPYYERPVERSCCKQPAGQCAGPSCRVKTAKSPNFWLSPASLY